MTKNDVRSRIEQIGIIPSVRVSSAEDAMFAAEAVYRGGIPIVEVTLTVPGAMEVITHLVKNAPEMIVGAGSVLDVVTARLCLKAGAKFLTSDGIDLDVVKFAVQENVVIFPGALTPTDVIAARKAGSDLIKIVPCGQVGGDSYIRALKAMFPSVSLIAAGGVNQKTAYGFILAGATALGIGKELVSREAIHLRQAERIRTLADRFLGFVNDARNQTAAH
ncbi:MAG TPA: bifunctional 4-hydroxy-2-oxoglutarate aldolase/2-dehydro-3-deoxy-phosphogluconate aldolase [Candidatus Acidoferrum sp.]|nr:bifunctional 4-hydroxy-2-oxoglutarate aldolase/2-dehydro-3-deoxy-phosphogluconate aldolase [Candidatus Acidoferrum sp.]